MKLNYSLVTRRTFLNTLFGGWLATFSLGSLYAVWRGAFPTLGKEPDFVVLPKPGDFLDIPTNSTKPFAWGGRARVHLQEGGQYRSGTQRRLLSHGM